MTVASDVSRSGPYNGNGSTTIFNYEFRILDAEHLQVIKTLSSGHEITLTLGTDYTVSGVGNPDGGQVTLSVAPSAGEKLTILRSVPFVQETDLENQGPYYAETVEDAFDLATMRDQQLREQLSRTLRIPASSQTGSSLELPAPEASNVIGWNGTATGLRNYDAAEFATIVAYGQARADIFDGDGVTTAFELTDSPANIANLDVSIGGVTQLPNTDFQWSSGTTITFTSPPPLGEKILVRYMRALPVEDSALRVELAQTGGEGLITGWTVSALLADTTLNYGNRSAGDIIFAGGFRYEVAPSIATDEHVTTAGGLKLYVLPDGGVYYNIRAFGAVGNEVHNDTPMIQKAVNVAALLGGVAFVPTGNFRTEATINLPTNGAIVGADRDTSVLIGFPNRNHSIITIDGRYTRVEGLFIRGGYVGIRHDKWPSKLVDGCQIYNNRIMYNTVGVLMNNAFICEVARNYICFNSVGIISGGGDYELLIRNNVIDNNIGSPTSPGGAGILLYGTSGAVITDNTIEGNRMENGSGGPSVGVAVWSTGINQRTILRGNWCEYNGNQPGSADFIIGRPNETWVTDLQNAVIPTEWRGQFTAPTPSHGVMQIDGNHFLGTKRGVVINLDGAIRTNVTVTNNKFSGSVAEEVRPIELIRGSSSGTGRVKINIHDNGVMGLTAEVDAMMQGIKASYVYHVGDTIPEYGLVKLDGEDLFTARMTTAQFLGLTGATLNVSARAPLTGTATIENGAVKTFGGGAGVRTAEGTGRARAGSSAVFSGTEHVWAVIARGSGSGWTIQAGGNFGFTAANDTSGRTLIHERTALTQNEAQLHTGDYFGWLVMTKAQFDSSSIRGVRRLEISDIQMSEAIPPSP